METKHLGPNTLLFHSHFIDPGYTSFKIDRTSRRSHWLLVLLLGITFSSLIVSQVDRGIDPVDSDRIKQNPGTRVVHRLVRSRQCELLDNGGHSRSTGGGEGYSLGADLRSDPHQVRESCTGSRLKVSPSPNQDPQRADIAETRAYSKKQKNTSLHSFSDECNIKEHLHSTTNCREQPRSQQNYKDLSKPVRGSFPEFGHPQHYPSKPSTEEQARRSRGPHRVDESVDPACNLQGPHRTAEIEEIPTKIKGGETHPRRENQDDSGRKARRSYTAKNKHEGDKSRSVRCNWKKNEEQEGRCAACEFGLHPTTKHIDKPKTT